MEQSMELFQEIDNKSGPGNRPLAYRIMPRTWDDFVGQDHILGEGRLLRRLVSSDRLSSLILFGPSGCGKTALINIILELTKFKAYKINAVTAGVGDIRKVINRAKEQVRLNSNRTILVIDEIHHFNRSQQDALLPDVESGNIILIGLTTENPLFFVNSALISRSNMFEFRGLKESELSIVIERALKHPDGLGAYSITITPEAKGFLITQSEGDARRALNALEMAVLGRVKSEGVSYEIKLFDIEEALSKKHIAYDKTGDRHYDVISAFIKSLRGSDPDAALYYLALMLEAGENPLFIARRLVISASEDVGNADPMALVTADSGFSAVYKIGMPEARIILAHVTTYIASAPKSNASYMGLGNAQRRIKEGPVKNVPDHLKDSSLDGKSRGHGKGYLYPHDFIGHFVEQDYLSEPDARKDMFYFPSESGVEKNIKERLEKLWQNRKKYQK